MPMGGSLVRALCLAAAGAAVPWPGIAAELADLSLEQLREVVVVTVSRRQERLDRAAASVFVITNEDIRRSGAITLPEALRLAPQLNVAQVGSSGYAISARGLNSPLANNMLVLIDGRTVYTPLYSGVFWEAQDVLLGDVERIEVVSGPSSALWGSNAVNGLIHVITRSAADTQGPAALAHAGNRASGAAVRHGGRLNDNTRFRVYAKSYDRSDTRRADGQSMRDAANGLQAGLRADWARGNDSATLQGDIYRGSVDQPLAEGGRWFSGANLLGRWERGLPGDAQLTVQAYADHTERNHPDAFSERLDTLDLVAQYAFAPAQGHRMVVGGGYRHAEDRTTHTAMLAFLPESRRLRWTRFFVQDQIALGSATELGLSTSVEHNVYTGTEWLPSMRLAHRRGTGTWWASLSRAVRAPSRFDRDFFIPGTAPFALSGGPHFESEVSRIAELGYRGQPLAQLSYSLTLFHHEHEGLRSVRPNGATAELRNDIEGHSRGLEGWITWRGSERWRLTAGGTLLDQHLRVKDGQVDFGGMAALGNDPKHWWQLRSSFDLTPQLAWELGVRRVGALPNPAVPAYTAVDSRLAWSPWRDFEMALVLRNLADPRHPEWGASPARTEFERSAALQLRWRL
jgi:iron complex outermembrane recepter protein